MLAISKTTLLIKLIVEVVGIPSEICLDIVPDLWFISDNRMMYLDFEFHVLPKRIVSLSNQPVG